MPIKVQPVILCGGSGTRLWPLSRSGFPKQFLCLAGQVSLFQQAVSRLCKFSDSNSCYSKPYIVSNEDHRFMAMEQLREMGIQDARFLLEPVGRNTAPALTLAALLAQESGTDPVLMVTPSDQVIANEPAFHQAMYNAVVAASEGSIVVLGVPPSKAETGYGYVHVDDSCESNQLALDVLRFVEKPDKKTAERYLEQGGYLWNAGIFVLKASVWLDALKAFRPDMFNSTKIAWEQKNLDGAFIRPDKQLFSSIPADSVDYAVMEKCEGTRFKIKTVPLDAGWSDLGSWDAVWDALPKDGDGNTHLGDVLATESQNTLVNATSRLVSLVGVSDLVIVETPDAVLVADKSRSQNVKQLVDLLNQSERPERALHRKVHRPWGWYDSIDEGNDFKVKRIHVKPKASLSLQKHKYRAEHWVVVKGRAEVNNDGEVFVLDANQSTYIPCGAIHRLTNPDDVFLELVEVQTGKYLGEDDIERFSDNYGRGNE